MMIPLNLLDLGNDILYIILTKLGAVSPSSLLCFAKSSKDCKVHAIPVILHTITLQDQGIDKKHARQLIDQLLDPNHESVKHVKDLTIAGFGTNEDFLSASELETIVSNTKRLAAFRWNTPTMIPEAVLLRLESRHPETKLYVTNHHRGRYGKQEKHMDIPLLSSRLLYSLDYSIDWWLSDYYGSEVYSELPLLDPIISRSPQLRHLNIGFYQAPLLLRDSPDPVLEKHIKATLIELPADYKLPNLHKLQVLPQYSSMDSKPVAVTKLTSLLSHYAASWSQVTDLSLHCLCPLFTFNTLTGKVPNVKVLELRLDTRVRSQHYPKTFTDTAPVAPFISAIRGLEEINLRNQEADIEFLWPAIAKHAGTLKKLAIHSPPDYNFRVKLPQYWSAGQLSSLLGSPIEDLELDMSVTELSKILETATTTPKPPGETSFGQETSFQCFTSSQTSLAVLSQLSSLRRLKLWVRLDNSASVFSDVYKYWPLESAVFPPLKVDQAKESAIAVFKELVTHAASSFKELELVFIRQSIGDRMDSTVMHFPFMVRREERESGEGGGISVETKERWGYDSSYQY